MHRLSRERRALACCCVGAAIRSLTIVAACLALAWPAGHGAAEGIDAGVHPQRLLLAGSSTMSPLMKAIAVRFQALHPGVEIEVDGGGSGRGIAALRDGRADVGMFSRALTDTGDGLYGFPIARDGVCIILHADNPLRELNAKSVVRIFTGAISNWRAVGGHDAPIVVINPELNYSSTELFTAFFNVRYSQIKARLPGGDNATRIAAVASRPGAITYVSVGEAERKAHAGARIKLLPVDGVAATSANIRSGNYPLSRPLTLVTRGLPSGITKQFIDFSLSSQVSDLVEAHDFVPYMD